MFKILTFTAILAISGCAGLATPDSYWRADSSPATPDITVVVTDHLAAWCPQFPFAKGCASRDLAQGKCWVYVQPVWKDSADLIEHEKCHCLGYDHEIAEVGFGNLNALGVRSHMDVVAMSPKCPVSTAAVAHTVVDDREPLRYAGPK